MIAYNLSSLSSFESGVVALSLGAMVFSVSRLTGILTGYQNTLDLAPILAAIFTTMFSSNLGKVVLRIVSNISYLRWFIPLVGLLLTAASFIIKS